MKVCQHTRVLGVLSVLGLLLVPAASSAEITGFQFNGIVANGGTCDLADRLGKSNGSTSHVINLEDCEANKDCNLKVTWSLTSQPADGSAYVVKVSEPGGSCPDDDLTTDSETCVSELVQKETSISNYASITFTIDFALLTGGYCGAGTDQATKIYISKNELEDVNSQVLLFQVDLEPPAAPELDEFAEGDQNVTVTWSDPDNESETNVSYRVYWAKEPFTDNNKAALATRGPAKTAHSYQVTGLENNTEYWFGVVAVDENDNEGPLSAVSSAMPIPVLDFFELYRSGSEAGQEDGGFCFIATAAFGSYMAPDVWTLRRFRDEVLMTTAPGRAFVRAYYAASPPLASWIARSEASRAVVRVALQPLVWLARGTLALPQGLGSWLLAGLGLAWALAVGVTAFRVVHGSRRRS